MHVAFALVPALLALLPLERTRHRPARFLGLDLRRPSVDLGLGLLIAAGIGIPGIGLYLCARAAGVNTQVQASAPSHHWWTILVLVLAAAQNAVLEQVVMVSYLFTRLTQLGWRLPMILLVSAVIRSSYHLYRGFVGNISA